MSNEDNQIQAGSPLPSARHEADAPLMDELTRRYRTRWAGTVFGAIAGLPLGAVVGAICYWLADLGDYGWEGALFGACGGVAAGAVIGFLERTIRGDLTKPDVATYIGVLFGIVVTVLVLGGVGSVVLGRVFIGFLFAGPMAGLLFGAMLDRAYEGSTHGHWFSTGAFGALALAGSAGIIFLVVEYSDPDPKDVEREAWQLIAVRPEMENAQIQKIELDPPEHRTYRGIMLVKIAEQVVQFDLEVHVRHTTISATWVPRLEVR